MTRETLLKAIKAELSPEELDEVYHFVYTDDFDAMESDTYYYPDFFINTCMKRIANEIDDNYFKTWLIILCNMLNGSHQELSDFFDGWSWDNSFPELNCNKGIATIRDYNIQFLHRKYVKYHKNHNMKVIYLRYEFVDHSHDEDLYKCYIVDHKNKLYDVRIVDTSMLTYDLSKNYCWIVDEEHKADIRRQEDDDSLEYVDHTKPEKQFCEAEEELQIIFFNESYKRNKRLEL